MPDDYAAAVEKLMKAKVRDKAPEVTVEHDTKKPPKVVNIMTALKESMQKRGQAKTREAVNRHMGKKAGRSVAGHATRPTPSPRRTAH
jgi:non-homologous end joining protein Ku